MNTYRGDYVCPECAHCQQRALEDKDIFGLETLLVTSMLTHEQEAGLRILNKIHVIPRGLIPVGNNAFSVHQQFADIVNSETGKTHHVRREVRRDDEPLQPYEFLEQRRYLDRVLAAEEKQLVDTFATAFWADAPASH